MTYRERRENKAARLREWAEAREAKSSAAYESASATIDLIPLGQPILVGHHSEKRSRAMQSKIAGNMSKSIEHQQKADKMRDRAANIEAAAAHAIYSDDPDAIQRVEERLAKAECKRESIKAFNATCRKGAPNFDLLDADLLKSYNEMQGMRGYIGTRGEFPSFVASNLSGNITRLRKRLALLKRRGGAQV